MYKLINDAVLQQLPFANKRDFEDARRGFIAPLPDNGVIRNQEGKPVWDLSGFSFIKEDAAAPETVNPSLWRQSQLLNYAGLFQVTDRVYQVRGADASNIEFIEGDTGIIMVDPLISAECARAALNLFYQHRPRKPVVAVIYSHSHLDHFGGVKGVISEDDVKAGKIKVIAPEGFLKAALDENVMAGTAMSRRAGYMYGVFLPAGPQGKVTMGLGPTVSTGTVTLIPPTDVVTKSGQEMILDGLKFVFQLAPDTEAPAEMHFYLPQLKLLCPAENCCHNLHNLYTLRGAKTRDALAWSKALDETLERWGNESEVMLNVHHWPIWGRERIVDRLKKQRDMYRYLHDQTLRLANEGYTMTEIAEMIQLPESLEKEWYCRGYYGSVNHNVKGVYVKYLGWFDGNPANLHPLPPEEASKRYVEFMGGAAAVIKKAQEYYDKGEYRWVAEVMNRVVFADPNNHAAKELQAKALEQLGYQAESGPWRNFYLTGAQELRHGIAREDTGTTASPDTIRAMPLGLFFDYLGVRLNGPKAEGKTITINWNFTDTKEQYVLALENGALNNTANKQAKEADASVTLTRAAFGEAIMGGQPKFLAKIAAGDIKIEGQMEKLGELLSLMDNFDPWFNIVTP
ncbi:MAG: alkyl sulfatase dimerization domain-containing protein [Desulfobaccales bacterium]|jgi:alkyl sulfatase BDS1-like metallo-beta-lactamase superfamily hydrolase